jgi:hypothetical protein
MMPRTMIPLSRRIKFFLNPVLDKQHQRALLDYFQAIIFCQHNARVIADFEDRMSAVISRATNRMSKPYYTKEAMLAEIEDALQRSYDEGYEEGKKDAA